MAKSEPEIFSFKVANTWDGEPVASDEAADFTLLLSDAELSIKVTAPFYDDPPPPGPQGAMDGLWNYEVVELFLLGADGHYLEIEMGPHGHYLVLLFSGVRQLKKEHPPDHFSSLIIGPRWQGELLLSLDKLPVPFSRFNAYAIHGRGDNRRYLATHPVPGEKPDFHQPAFFEPFAKI